MTLVDKKFDVPFDRISCARSTLAGVFFTATMLRIEKQRSASEIDRVPSAESLRPAKGNTSGPRWHWLLRLSRHWSWAVWSIHQPATSALVVNSASCWPTSALLRYG